MSDTKKGAKFGRGNRSPSSKTYHLAKRWDTNKAKRIKRDLRIKAKAQIKKIMRMAPVMRDYEKLTEYRQIVAQNRTG